MDDERESLADYFDRTKDANRRALEKLGHHWPAASAADAQDDDRRHEAYPEEQESEPGQRE